MLCPGASHLLPIDFYVIGSIAPLFAQILFSNASKAAIVTAWMISVACFNAGHYVVGAAPDNYIWLNFTCLFFMYSSYEIESRFVERFLLTKVCMPVFLRALLPVACLQFCPCARLSVCLLFRYVRFVSWTQD